MSAQHEVEPLRLPPPPHDHADTVDDTAAPADEQPAVAPALVRRRAWLHLLVAVAAAALAAGYWQRALSTEAVLGFAVAALLTAVAIWQLALLADARSPLLVADRTGVRVRSGRAWRGLRWREIETAVVVPRRGLRDGTVSIRPVSETGEAQEAPLRVIIGYATTSTGDLGAQLRRLAQTTNEPQASTSVLLAPATDPSPPREPAVGTLRPVARAEVTNPASARSPALAMAVSAEVATAEGIAKLSGNRQLRRSGPGNVSVLVGDADGEATERAGEEAERSSPAVGANQAGEQPPIAIIGPQLRQARERLGASVNDVANRTRIRAHVIEGLEVDDFGPCAGDFYARGHIRAIGRVLGIDPEPLVRIYDEHYAAAPISPRAVFQADFAAGSNAGIQRTGGGPQWGALAATVLVLTLVWGIARLIFGA